MISEDGNYIECDVEFCEAKVKNHRWGKTKAEGWFFSRNGELAFCPDHIPEFVSEYRRRKEAKAKDE